MGELLNRPFLIIAVIFQCFLFSLSCSKSKVSIDHGGDRSRIQSEKGMKVGDDMPIQSSEDIEAYWTEERMRKAKPMPLPVVVIPERRENTKAEDRR